MKKSHIVNYKMVLLVIILSSIIIVGCSSKQEAQLTPEEVLGQSFQTMKNLPGFSFLILPTGKEVYLDQQKTIILSQAEGEYVTPDKVTATVKIIFSGIVAQVSVITIGEDTWETNVLTGGWQKSTADYAFQPLSLFNPDSGLIAVISEDTTELEMEQGASIEELPGVELFHLSGTIEGSRINQLSAGLIENKTLAVELWITPDTYELHRLLIADPSSAAEDTATTWQMDFWNFGETADIQAPQ